MSKKIIYAEDAIDAVHAEFDECLVWDESGQYTADEVERILTEVPSAQPERCEDCVNFSKTRLLIPQPEKRTEERTETHSCDLIDRKMAIDALGDMVMNWTDSEYELGQLNQWKEDRKAIIDMPSAQPEIIRCRDCKHMQEDKIFHQCWCNGNEVKPDHFCGYAERKEKE